MTFELKPCGYLDRRKARAALIATACVIGVAACPMVLLGAWPVLLFVVAELMLLHFGLKSCIARNSLRQIVHIDAERVSILLFLRDRPEHSGRSRSALNRTRHC
jgi:uncharacterized membrane protein